MSTSATPILDRQDQASPIAATDSQQMGAPISKLERLWVDRIFVGCVRRFPKMMRALRPCVTWVLWHVAPGWRRAVLHNAQHLLGAQSTQKERARLAREVFSSFYLFICEVGEACRLTAEEMAFRVQVLEGIDEFIKARSNYHGAILVTAHLGSFECSLAVLQNFEENIHVLFARDDGSGFNQLRSEARRNLNVQEAQVNQGIETWIRLRDALERDEIVVMQGDRVMAGQRGTEMEFFGTPTEMPTGPIRLAMVTGAPLVPVYSTRLPDGRLKLVVEPPIEVEPNYEGPLSDHPAMIDLMTSLQRVIGESPGQWIVVDPVWPLSESLEEA